MRLVPRSYFPTSALILAVLCHALSSPPNSLLGPFLIWGVLPLCFWAWDKIERFKDFVPQVLWYQFFFGLIAVSMAPLSVMRMWDLSWYSTLAICLVLVPQLVIYVTIHGLLRRFLIQQLPRWIAILGSVAIYVLLNRAVAMCDYQLALYLSDQPWMLSPLPYVGFWGMLAIMVGIAELMVLPLRRPALRALPLLTFWLIAWSLHKPAVTEAGPLRLTTIPMDITLAETNAHHQMKHPQRFGGLDRHLQRLSNLSVDESSTLVLGETFFNFYYFHPRTPEERERRDTFRSITSAWNSVIFGGFKYDPARGMENVVIHRRPGAPDLVWGKRILMPFGERLPFSLESGAIPLVPAATINPIITQIQGVPVGLLICNEIYDHHLSLLQKNLGAQATVVIGNEMWTEGTTAASMLRAAAVLRAVETGVPIFKMANLSVPLVIAPDGSVTRPHDWEKQSSWTVQMPLPRRVPEQWVTENQLIVFLLAIALATIILASYRAWRRK